MCDRKEQNVPFSYIGQIKITIDYFYALSGLLKLNQ